MYANQPDILRAAVRRGMGLQWICIHLHSRALVVVDVVKGGGGGACDGCIRRITAPSWRPISSSVSACGKTMRRHLGGSMCHHSGCSFVECVRLVCSETHLISMCLCT